MICYSFKTTERIPWWRARGTHLESRGAHTLSPSLSPSPPRDCRPDALVVDDGLHVGYRYRYNTAIDRAPSVDVSIDALRRSRSAEKRETSQRGQ